MPQRFQQPFERKSDHWGASKHSGYLEASQWVGIHPAISSTPFLKCEQTTVHSGTGEAASVKAAKRRGSPLFPSTASSVNKELNPLLQVFFLKSLQPGPKQHFGQVLSTAAAAMRPMGLTNSDIVPSNLYVPRSPWLAHQSLVVPLLQVKSLLHREKRGGIQSQPRPIIPSIQSKLSIANGRAQAHSRLSQRDIRQRELK